MTEAPAPDRLVRHGMFLLAMSQVSNFSNMAFHMVMGRYLTPDEYGVLATMLNLLLVLATPLDALRNAMAHSAGRSMQRGDRGAIRVLARLWLMRALVIGIPAGSVLVLASEELAGFFHLASPDALRVAGFLLPIMLLVPILSGLLQGAQAFVWMSLTMHGWGVIRLALASALVVWVAASATAGVVSHAVAQLLSLVVGMTGVLYITRGAQLQQAPAGVGGYFVQSLLMLAGFGVLMNSDVMLVRHYHPEQAGHFAWAATIGRSVIFLPMPIALAMFPKVISMGASSAQTRRTLARAVLMAVGLIGAAVGAVWVLPGLPLLIIYGERAPSAELCWLVRWVCLAMSPLGVTYVLVHFEMAQHRFASVPWLLVCAAAYIGAVALWHASVLTVVLVLGLASLATALLFVIMLLRASDQPVH